MKAESFPRRAVTAALLTTLLATLAACGSTGPAPREVPPPPTTSVAQAGQQLAEVARERAAIEARYAERERVCYDKFFVNSCLDEARERRRSALAAQRAIEVQAERFKRQAVVDERDRKLLEAEKKYRDEEARMAGAPPQPARAAADAPPPRAASVPARVAERDARLKAAAAKEAAEAPRRAASVREYERRKAESAERQREVARRKTERAARLAKKDAERRAAQQPAAERKANADQGAEPAQAK